MHKQTNDKEIKYGIDMGSPDGDQTALSIKDGDTVYVFVGNKAEVILRLISQTQKGTIRGILELMLKQYEQTLKDGYGLKEFNVELRQKLLELEQA